MINTKGDLIMRALSINIYKHKNRDCSNNGLSSRYNELLLICEEGNIDIDENNPPENLVKLVSRHLFGRDYLHIEPVAKPGGAGWMSGGCVVYSCDSRFRRMSEYPLSLHDRDESWELYDKLSR